MSLNIESNKIRIAVVGCGRISNNHFQSIETHNDKIYHKRSLKLGHQTSSKAKPNITRFPLFNLFYLA